MNVLHVSTWMLAGGVLLACRELPPLPAGVCGNSVVEAGEDCDRAVVPALGPATACGDLRDAVHACRYTCGEAALGASCPSGWACRPDGVCHHGTGRYVAAASLPTSWFGDDWWAGEVDGDGVTDVLGATGAELRVVRGDGAGGLREGLRRALPIGTEASPAIGDLDGDGRLDAVVPSRQGLVVLRGQADTLLEPEVYAPFVVPAGLRTGWAIPLRLEGRLPQHSPVLLIESLAGVTLQAIPPVPGATRTIDERSLTALAPRPVIGDLDGDEDDELILAFEGDEQVAVCSSFRDVFRQDRALTIGYGWVPLGADPETGEPWRILRGALLADVDGDSALDLLVSVRGEEVLVLPGDGQGAFGEARRDPRFTEADGALPAPGWPLAAGPLDDEGGPDDYVTPTGVWRTDPADGALERTDAPFPAGARWAEAVILDHDGEGQPDVVVAERDEPVLHVLLGGAAPGPHVPTNVPTESVPTLLRVGDFDWDFAEDVAFRGGGSALSVLFGGTARPQRVASIPTLARLEVGALAYPIDGDWDPATDLLASLEPDAVGNQRAAVFVGAHNRVLESPLALLQVLQAVPPRAASVGWFLRHDEHDPTAEALVIAGPERSASLWLVRSPLDEAPSRPAAARVASLSGLATGCALWASGDVDRDGQDELLGLWGDGCEPVPTSAAIRVDLDAETNATVTELPGPPSLGLSALAVFDLDGDGAADLVRSDEGGVSVCWSDGSDVDLAAAELLPAAPDGARPRAAVVLQTDADPALELVVATDEALWRAELGPGRAITWAEEPLAAFGATRLGAGDLDRDGLTDLLAGDGVSLVTLQAVSHLAGP